jgi:hypothetical protein
MTEEERDQEGAEEAIEDLEAPATAQRDVAGGMGCTSPSCHLPTSGCASPTCGENTFCRPGTIQSCGCNNTAGATCRATTVEIA